MTRFEELVLERLDKLTSEVGRCATSVARLEERQIAHDDRLEELEKTPAPRSVGAPKSRWCVTKDVGVSAAAIVALVTAVAQAWHAPPPPPPPPPEPRPALVAPAVPAGAP
jgi:hypothetical protein